MFMLGVDYEPTNLQKLWHAGASRSGAGRSSGKSTFVVMEALKRAVETDGLTVHVMAGNFDRAEYLFNIFRNLVSRSLYDVSLMTRTVKLPNGSEIRFRSFDSWIGDQCTMFDE